MPKPCSALVLLPVGPGTNLEFLADTLDSIRTFGVEDHCVLIVDDSGEGIGEKVKADRVDVLVNRAPGDSTKRSVAGRFFETIAKAHCHAVEQYDFKVLMRLDADALMTNPGAHEAAIRFHQQNPGVGLAGSYRVRCDGQPRDFVPTAKIIDEELGFHLRPAHRALAAAMKELVDPALKNGYEKGENVIAPGSVLSREAAERLAAHPYFGHPDFRATRLGDDHLVALTLRSLGYTLGDFATGDLPLAVWLRKIEWSPEEIVERGKAVTHSVRGHQDLDEAQVRERFRKLRA